MTPFISELDNGLRVLLLESHSAPVATFWVWYGVGSRNEIPGWTGISHWVEHMLFKGTPTYPKGVLTRAIERLGGRWNAFTSWDVTAYHEVLPAEHLPFVIGLEADRMRHTLFEPEEVESERTVIISEREGAENFPTSHLSEEVNALAFKVHSYRHPVIGWKSDLRRVTRDDLYPPYPTHYHPRNAPGLPRADDPRWGTQWTGRGARWKRRRCGPLVASLPGARRSRPGRGSEFLALSDARPWAAPCRRGGAGGGGGRRGRGGYLRPTGPADQASGTAGGTRAGEAPGEGPVRLRPRRGARTGVHGRVLRDGGSARCLLHPAGPPGAGHGGRCAARRRGHRHATAADGGMVSPAGGSAERRPRGGGCPPRGPLGPAPALPARPSACAAAGRR